MMLFFRSFFACYCASGLSRLFTQTAVTKKGKKRMWANHTTLFTLKRRSSLSPSKVFLPAV